MVRQALGLAVALALGGCSWLPTRVETVTVKVPVEIARVPPPELLECAARLEKPKFVGREDLQASSCLTPAGERALTRLVDRTITCVDAWKAWSAPPPAVEEKP
jgi:hypothetical protein